jgi:probable phosphoglycerate mutase
MKLYAVRHGEVTWNVEKRILGSAPGELTSKGRRQAQELARNIHKDGIKVAYASDLKRVVDTIDIARLTVPDLEVVFTPQLRERDYGELQGKRLAEVDWEGFWSLPPDKALYAAESLQDFTRRIALFVAELEGHAAEKVILVTHIGVMNRLHYFSDPPNFSFVNYEHAVPVAYSLEKILLNATAFLDGNVKL